MRILLVTPHFYPENFKCNDMAFELSRRGHEVSVMTAIPDYPQGKFFDGYGVFKRRREIVNGITIHRSLTIPRGKGGGVRLAVNYISYTFFASLQAIRIGLSKKFEAIIVFEPSPVLVGIPAVIVRKLQHVPIYFWVQDLWPESLAVAGGIKNKSILRFFEKLTVWLYRHSEKILISSKGFRKSICAKGDFNHKIIDFPNWVDEVLQCRSENTIEPSVPKLPAGFTVMFAGNMGDAQDLPSVMTAATALKDYPNIHFVFVGNGRKKEWVERYTKEYRLENTVHCLGRFPLDAMPYLFAQADVLFLSLKDSEIFSLTVPARLQAYMSAGKPVVAMLNGEGRQVINEAQCGYSVPAGDSQALAELLIRLSQEDIAVLQQKGDNGKRYSTEHYDFQTCINHLIRIIHKQ